MFFIYLGRYYSEKFPSFMLENNFCFPKNDTISTFNYVDREIHYISAIDSIGHTFAAQGPTTGTTAPPPAPTPPMAPSSRSTTGQAAWRDSSPQTPAASRVTTSSYLILTSILTIFEAFFKYVLYYEY